MAENAELLPTADDVAVEEVVTDLMLQETREADQGAEGQGVSTDGTIGLAASSNPADTLLGGGAMSAAANSMMPQSMERSPAASEPANSAKVEGLENGEDHASSSAATKVVGGGENEHSREVPAETDLELLARHKTKEQEIVESEEVVARMERIEQRSRLGFTGEDAKAEGQGAPEEEKQEEEEEEEEEPRYYDPASLDTPPGPSELPSSSGRLLCSFGLDGSKRGAMDYIAEDVLVFPAANTVQTLNVRTMVQAQMPIFVGQGVSTITVHPSRQWFAVCEKGFNPSVFIYTYPSLQLYKIMRGGTERLFGCAVFSHDGRELATVGGYPDYWLTVWDWRHEAIKLRAKAFSQDVFKVCFSPSFAGQLITSGTGHIRFWKMAATFTGLKLQGQLGKFGAVPLSDISGFVELPDGKVLSGTESGTLLLWDGGFIKCEITRPGGIPCHVGNVECLQLDRKRRQLITAGHDGYARIWDFDALDGADLVDDKPTFEMAPLEENFIGESLRCKTLLREQDHWIVQDERGAVLRVALPTFRSTRLLEFHSGPITGLDTHPGDHVVATAGEDATVRLYSYTDGAQKQLLCRAFNRAARCCAWAPDGRTLLVGFADGVLRALARASGAWKLAQVVKPHTGAITCLALSTDGQHLATGSEDGTVFFFQAIESGWNPVGYFVAPGPVSCATWQADSQKLLVGCRSGQIVEVTRPGGTEDTSKTLALDLPSNTFNFLAAQQAAAAARVAAEREAAAKKRAEENPDGLAPDDEPPPPSPSQPVSEDPPAVEALLRHENDPNMFYVSFRGDKHPGMYVCNFSGGKIVEQKLPEAGVLRGLSVSRGGQFLAVGGEEGKVRVQPWGSAARARAPGWQNPAHDGACLAAASFDDAFLLSGGASGVLLVHRLNLEGVPERNSAPDSVPAESAGQEPVDITDESAYSLEDAKQKEEADKLRAAALRRQMSVKEQLAEIRRELAEEIERNRNLPPGQRVAAEEMEVDPGLRSMMAAETEAHVALAHRELEWETEKANVALAKLRRHFLEPLETERIVVDALSSGRHVSTFQTLRLSADVQAAIAALDASEMLRRQPSMMTPGSRRRTREAGGIPSPSYPNTPSPHLNHSGESIREAREESAAAKQAQRRKLREMREVREQEWAVFNKTRPDPAYENPADLAAIQAGWDTLGDFKLKSDPEYIVPEAQRIDAGKKHAQMLRLTEAVHRHTRAFNLQVLNLRARREGARGALEADVERVRAINKQLGMEEPPLFEWHSNARERPEAREDVGERELADFRKQQKQAARDAKNQGGGKGLGGFGGQAAAAPEADAEEEPGVLSPAAVNRVEQGPGSKAESSGKENTPRRAKKGREYRKSDLEIAEQDAAERRLRHEKAALVAKVARAIAGFDADVDRLRTEKLSLKAKLKAAEGRMLVMHKELELLKEFEKKDHMLNSKSAAKKAEQEELGKKADDLDEKLEAKQAELSAGAAAKAELLAEFDRLVDPGHSHREALLKVYNKKVKRVKKKENNRGPDDDEEESEEEESDDEDMDDDEEGDTCPAGCERATFDNVCQLREKKLDQDDLIADVTKAMEALKREQDALGKKLKTVEAAMKAVEKEMDDFQKEKQGALNQIDVALTLSLHQIQHLSSEGRLPDDLSSSLVFSNGALARLGARVRELGDEKGALRLAQRDLHRQHLGLHKQKKEKEKKIAELQQRAVDVQMLKFGQVIDLKLLEAVGDSAGAEELRASLAEQERVHARELGEWKRAIDRATDVLADVTAENTACLNRAAELGEQHQRLEQGLVATQHSVLADAVSMKRKEAEERDKMVQVVNDQAGELERLKAEIRVLKSKGPIKTRV